jgi:hypothetical protein
VPLLLAGNWGGEGLHSRGNFEGFANAASERKWLEVHGIEHWTHFYSVIRYCRHAAGQKDDARTDCSLADHVQRLGRSALQPYIERGEPGIPLRGPGRLGPLLCGQARFCP